MSIKYIDDSTNIYIMKKYVDNVDFTNKKELEVYLKKLFKILKEKYLLTIEGFYDVCIYVDKYYGIVISLQKEELDYYNYYKDEVDMKISIVESTFLYQIDNFNHNGKIHIINNNMYLEITSDISDKDMMNLIENSNNILYNYSK